MIRGARPVVAVLAIVMLAGCAGSDSNTGPRPRPMIHDASVALNPNNVLSAVVSVRATHADSVGVIFHVAGSGSGTDSTAPVALLTEGSARVPVLGLMPSSAYVLRVIAYGNGHREISDSITFTTGALPDDLPRFDAGGSDPSPGFVVFGTALYGQVIDNTGRVVWYHRFANGPGLNFMPQLNGRYVARPASADTSIREQWIEIDPLGNNTRTLGCVGGLRPRLHDLISEPNGSYWIMCDEIRTMDLRASGGVNNAQVTGTVVQHVGPAGQLIFQWSPFDHFDITDLDPASRSGSAVNWTHGNAIDVDSLGDLIVSFRSLNEITKIDVPSGQILWRLGGVRNQFTFYEPKVPPFARQHSARMYPSDRLAILDNMGDPTESRVEWYVIDPLQKTAALVQSYGSVPGVVTPIGGSVQYLPGQRTLVSFGTSGRVEEFDQLNRLVWAIQGNAGYVFRAQRITSLYTPGTGLPR